MENETSNQKQAETVLRDSKGRFVSEKGMRVIKDKKSKPPKSLILKLNDLNEHNVSKFIESIVEHNPDRVSVVTRTYYSQKEVDSLKYKIAELGKKVAELEGEAHIVDKEVDTIEKTVEVLIQENDELHETNETLIASRNKWRDWAIGLIIGIIASLILGGCLSYVQTKNCTKPLQSTGWIG
jgi:hypothetical protein